MLAGAVVGAAAAIIGQLTNERYKRHRDRQMTARGIAASIEATLIMTDRRDYVGMIEGMLAQIQQGRQIKAEKRGRVHRPDNSRNA
jgi:hypothetical protein